MNSLSLILRIVAILAAATAVVLFVISKGTLAEQEAALKQAQASSRAMQTELAHANREIESLKTQLSTERNLVADLNTEVQSSRSEAYTAQSELERTQNQLEHTKNEISHLESDATRLREALVKTEESLASTSKESKIAQLQERINELVKANDALQQEITAAEAFDDDYPAPNSRPTTDLEPLRTKPKAPMYRSSFATNIESAVKPASIGIYTVVSSISTADGIIVLDSSPELGLTVGSEITLIQGLHALGKVEITELTEQFVIANILPGAKVHRLSKGDNVKILH